MPTIHRPHISPAAVLLPLCICGVPAAWGARPTSEETSGLTVLDNGLLRVTFDAGGLRSIEDLITGAPLVYFAPSQAAWGVYFGNELVRPPAEGRLTVTRGDGTVTATLAATCPGDRPVDGALSITMGEGPDVELRLEVHNRSDQIIESAVFPRNALCPKGPGRYLVYPYESGILVPLDERFARIKLYGHFPFVMGYPSNRCSMQWFGVYGPEGGFMLQGTDPYGSLRRMGAQDADTAAELLCEHQLSLQPGEQYTTPMQRLTALPGGTYREMAALYRASVLQRTSGPQVSRERLANGQASVPLQYIPLEAKLLARPRLAQALATHGYPEHAVREDAQGSPIPYVPYGVALGFMRNFEAVYRGRVTPQLWSPFVEAAGGRNLLPQREFLEQPLEIGGTRFPGLSLYEFLRTLNREQRLLFLYVNPTFWREGTEGYDPSLMFDADGDGVADTFGGSEAGASAKEAYVSPYLVREHMAGQLRPLAGLQGDAEAGAPGVMFDSSQVFGAVMWWGSRVRGDRISCIDRNPKADHVGRWGHVGRESGVQEKLQTYLALHEATPRAARIGEWIGEFQPMFLDMNAGSICLKREYPDGLERPAEENVIPVPLFQMVYGDSELFVVRVGAASDAHMAPQDPDAIIPAEVTRRGSALFGAVHQVLYWGGVRWAGEAFNRLRARTWMVVRDNVARRTLLGRPADFHMLDGGDQETPGLFSVRRTAWLDAKQSPLALHWDNNTGASASASGELDGRALRIDNLWGAPEALPGSLGRLKPGSTVTATRDGTFCLWSFAGTVESDGVPWVTVGDSASTPAGLSVIWDGEFLSLSNESAEPRTVTVRVAGMPGELVPVPDLAPLTPDGEATEGPSMVYNQATEWSQTVEGGVRVLTATLPGATRAAADRAMEVPATLAAFTSR